MKDLSNLYLVSGRISDLNDVVCVVFSDQGLGHAKRVFKGKLLAQYEDDFGKEEANAMLDEELMIISSARPLAEMVADPLMLDDPELLARVSSEDDEVVFSG